MKKIIVPSIVSVFLLGALITFVVIRQRPEKIKMYSFYTPSHEWLVNDWFLPSLQAYDDYELILERHEQRCKEGSFMADGWMETMRFKVDLIIRAIKENWNNIFVHADVDVQFFGATQEIIRNLMHDKDMMCQLDTPYGMPCAGFFACRGNEKTLQLWKRIRAILDDPKNGRNDQLLLFDLIKQSNPYNIDWDFLPPDKFIGGGTYTGTVWEPGKPLYIPQGTLMHHANSNVGSENKLKQLNLVKNIADRFKNGTMITVCTG